MIKRLLEISIINFLLGILQNRKKLFVLFVSYILIIIFAVSIVYIRKSRYHRILQQRKAWLLIKRQTDPYWITAKKEVYRDYADLLSQNNIELAQGIIYRKFFHGNYSRKEIALTFDDGPHPAFTPMLLAVLKKYNIKATFFLVGEMAEKYPELVKTEFNMGNNIGNHTYDHIDLVNMKKEDAATEIEACGDVLESITGTRPHLFRPPGGDYDYRNAEIAEALKYAMILWTVNPGDYEEPGNSALLSRIFSRIGNGGIILLHDGIKQTIDSLPNIIETLQKQGYKFVTIDEMIKNR